MNRPPVTYILSMAFVLGAAEWSNLWRFRESFDSRYAAGPRKISQKKRRIQARRRMAAHCR